jgi:ABC-2 type transport system ATP-binding protein
MGFRLPKNGKITIEGNEPHKDDLNLKKNIVFLSEKMELPVYWKVKDYLSFHKYFYPNYSDELEAKLLKDYKITRDLSFRSLSAGENKRAQIVGALASRPQLLFVD